MDKLQGIDVSESNGEINWAEVKDNFMCPKFVFAKATEGKTIQDARFRENHDGCKAENIPFGPYHFFHFGTSSPEDQYANFKAVTNGYTGQLLPMIDVEGASQDGITDVGVMVHRLSQFLQLVEKDLKGQKAILYTGYSFWGDVMKNTDAFSGHLCFVAAYESLDNPVPKPEGFKEVSLWQHSSSGKLFGIPSRVDEDELEVDLSLIMRS